MSIVEGLMKKYGITSQEVSGLTQPKTPTSIPILGKEMIPSGLNVGGLSTKPKEEYALDIATKRQALAKGAREGSKAFSESQEEKLMGLFNTSNKLKKLSDEFQASSYKTGILWGNIPLYVRPVKETGFLGDLKQQFNLYRKYITGVQAGFPELKALQVSFPAETNTRQTLVEKLNRTVDSNNEIIGDWLDFKEAQGYNVSPFRGVFKIQQEKGLFD